MDRTDLKVAQLRYDPSERTWSLYCRNRHGRWFLYDGIQPATSIVPLLTEIDEDPTGISGAEIRASEPDRGHQLWGDSTHA